MPHGFTKKIQLVNQQIYRSGDVTTCDSHEHRSCVPKLLGEPKRHRFSGAMLNCRGVMGLFWDTVLDLKRDPNKKYMAKISGKYDFSVGWLSRFSGGKL